MHLGEVGLGCPVCGSGEHGGECAAPIRGLLVTVEVRGLWRYRVACWLVQQALRLLEWSLASLTLKVKKT